MYLLIDIDGYNAGDIEGCTNESSFTEKVAHMGVSILVERLQLLSIPKIL